MWWLLAASAASVCFATVAFGTVTPLRTAGGLDYLFVWPAPDARLAVWLAAALLPGLAFAVVVAVAQRQRSGAIESARRGRWLAPLTGLGVVALGAAPAIPHVGDRASVIGYFFHDLRWWWLLTLAIWTIARADVMLGAPLWRRIKAVAALGDRARLLLLDSLIFAGLLTWALTTSPLIRFTTVFVGDEPKYLRYCELWYQGGGLDVSAKSLFAEQRLDAPPRVLHNLALLPGAIATDASLLIGDLQAFARHPVSFRWNRVTADSGFVRGKSGGVYQVHQPGLSAVLMPGYFIDRYLLSIEPHATGEFPLHLVMTTLTMLLLYAACGVALFRLLRQALASDLLALVWAAIAMATLPTTAFAFQIYPELPPLLILLVLLNYFGVSPVIAATESATSRLASAAAGAAAGSLAWFHPRFLLIVIVLGVLGTSRLRRQPRWAFLTALSLVLSTVGYFDYHVTGSWMPNALWDANGGGIELWTTGFLQNLGGYLLDRTWGLLPHAIVLAAALPGFIALAHENRTLAWCLVAIVLALLIPSAGHTLSAAGTTPDRLIVAVTPLLIVPVAAFVRRYWAAPTTRVITILAIVLSLDAGLAYDLMQDKSFGAMRDTSAIGWRLNLAFPIMKGDAWDRSTPNFLLFVAWAVVMAGACWMTLRSIRRADASATAALRRSPRASLVAPVVVGCTILACTAATAVNGDWTSDHFLMRESAARRRAATALVGQDVCRFCFSTLQPAMTWTRLQPNPSRLPHTSIGVAGRIATIDLSLDGDDDAPGFGRVNVDFGDGQTSGWMGVVGHARIVHKYAEDGEYGILTQLQLPSGSLRFERGRVTALAHP